MIPRAYAFLCITLSACAKSENREVSTPPPPTARITVADSVIKTPESVLYDPVADIYLISNINGNPGDKDNNGFISRLGTDGRMLEAHWIAGGTKGVTLNGPKGMALSGDTLFVADIDAVRLFNRTTGAPLGTREIKGATFLNDMAAGPDGTVYVTDTGIKFVPKGPEDTGTDAVYKFGAGGKAIALATGKQLGRPNGVTVDSSGVTVVTFGSGEVYRLDPKTGARSDLPKPPKGQLDGVERLADGSYLVSSWEGQAVYRLTGSVYTVAVDSVPSPADIGYDRKRGVVMIPIFTANRIEIRGIR